MLRFLSVVLVVLSSLLLVASHQRASRLGDLYACYIICDAEASYADIDDFEQIDSDGFIDIISRAKLFHIAFEPQWIVNLYDDEGIRYHVYVSRSCRYMRIDSNYFKLSRHLSKRLLNILENI